MRSSLHLRLVLILVTSIRVVALPDSLSLVIQTGHTAKVNEIIYSRDGNLLLTASNDYSIRLWRATKPNIGALLGVFSGHTGSVVSVAWNPLDSTKFASCAKDKIASVRLWSIGKPEASRVILLNPSDEPVCCAFNPSSNVLAVAVRSLIKENDGAIVFFDAEKGAMTDKRVPIGGNISRIVYVSNKIICTLSNGELYFIDSDTKERQAIPLPRVSGNVVCTLPLDKSVIVGYNDGTIRRVDFNGSVLAENKIALGLVSGSTCQEHASPLLFISRLAGKYEASVVSKYDSRTLQLVETTDTLYGDCVSCVRGAVYSPEQWVVLRSGVLHKKFQMLIHTKDEQTGAMGSNLCELPVSSSSHVTIDQHSGGIATSDERGRVWFWHPQSSPLTKLIDSSYDYVNDLRFDPQGKHLLIIGGNTQSGMSALVKDIDTERETDTEKKIPLTAFVKEVRFVIDSLIVARTDSGLVWYSYPELKILKRQNAKESIAGFSYSRGARILVTISAYGKLDLWDCEAMTLKSTRSLVSNSTYCAVAVSEDATRIFVAHTNGEIIEVSAQNKLFSSHAQNVDIVSLQILDTLLFSAGTDGRVSVWSLTSGRGEKRSYTQHAAKLTSLFITRLLSGEYVFATTGADGSTCIRKPNSTNDCIHLLPVESDWLVYMDGGMYDGSEHAADFVAFRVGSDVCRMSGLFEKYHYTNLLAKFWTNRVLEVPNRGRPLIPPSVSLLSPRQSINCESSTILLTTAVRTQGSGLKTIRLFSNNKLIEEEEANISDTVDRTRLLTFSVPISVGLNLLRVSAMSKEGSEYSDTVSVFCHAKATQDTTVYVVCIGINKYAGRPELTLKYAANDADAISEVFQNNEKIYPRLNLFTIRNERATRSEILSTLRRIAEKAKSTDKFVLYFAGHGEICHGDLKDEFCIVTYDTYSNSSSASWNDTRISTDTLREYLRLIKASTQMIVCDACHSGKIESDFAYGLEDAQQRSLSMFSHTGIVIFASAMRNQLSMESEKYKHGLFTYALLEGLKGEARNIHDDEITPNTLNSYLAKRLRKLSQELNLGPQYGEPVLKLTQSNTCNGFVLAKAGGNERK